MTGGRQMQGIEKEIMQKYDFSVREITPCKDSYVVNSSKGRMLLEKTLLPPGRLRFVHGAKEHLCDNHFESLDRYFFTIDGEPFFTYEQCNYILSALVEGRECNFENRNDVISASKTLALLHRASRGYVPPVGSHVQDELGKLPIYFGKRLSEMKKLKGIAKKGKHKFDYLFLKHVDYFYTLGESTLQELAASRYSAMVEQARRDGIFCHHDYTHSSILINDDKTSIIHFDFCCFELKAYDIVNLIRRKMRKCEWDIREAEMILNSYRIEEPLSRDDLTVIRLMLSFPQKFWRISNRFYNSKRSWSERGYMVKMQEAVDEIGSHRAFIESFDRIT